MKLYRLEKLVEIDNSKSMRTWQKFMESDDLDTLINNFATYGYRIVDNRTDSVVWEMNHK